MISTVIRLMFVSIVPITKQSHSMENQMFSSNKHPIQSDWGNKRFYTLFCHFQQRDWLSNQTDQQERRDMAEEAARRRFMLSDCLKECFPEVVGGSFYSWIYSCTTMTVVTDRLKGCGKQPAAVSVDAGQTTLRLTALNNTDMHS